VRTCAGGSANSERFRDRSTRFAEFNCGRDQAGSLFGADHSGGVGPPPGTKSPGWSEERSSEIDFPSGEARREFIVSRWVMLSLLVSAAVAAGTAHWKFGTYASVEEKVAATQGAVLGWSAGAALAAAAGIGVLAAATGWIIRWRYRIFNPIAILASTA